MWQVSLTLWFTPSVCSFNHKNTLTWVHCHALLYVHTVESLLPLLSVSSSRSEMGVVPPQQMCWCQRKVTLLPWRSTHVPPVILISLQIACHHIELWEISEKIPNSQQCSDLWSAMTSRVFPFFPRCHSFLGFWQLLVVRYVLHSPCTITVK